MKKTILTLALAGTFGVAAAQSMVTSIPATKPVVTSTAVAAAPAPAAAAPSAAANAANPAKQDPNINPFNGKLQSVEQLQRELEQTRMQTQVLEEKLKQTSLTEELKAVPLRKAVEVAQAVTAVKKEEVSQKELESAMRAPKAPAASVGVPGAVKPIPVKKAAPVHTVKPAAARVTSPAGSPTSAPTPAVAQAPRPTLLSVMNVGGSRSAVLEFAGATLVVADGDQTPFGVMKVRDQNSVDIGGNTVRVHSATMARFIVSDAKAVATQGAQIQGGAAAVGTQPPAPVVTSPAPGVSPAPSAYASPLGLPAQANGPLPALPLPPSTPAMAAPTPANAAMPGVPVAGPGLTLPPGVSILPAPTN
jgi:hypothetical protein